MTVKRDALRWGLSLAILLVLYLLVVFLVPFARTPVYWVSFGFTMVAFVVTTAATYSAFILHEDAKSRFYGFPITKIGADYGIAQMVLGLVVMALGRWVPVWLAVPVYALALGATCLGLIAADTAAEQIHIQDQKLTEGVTLMRSLHSQLCRLASRCDDPDAAADVKKFAEELRYSDPVSSDALADIERELCAVVDELQTAVIDGDPSAVEQLCRKANTLLAERNRLCKLNKA